ncbi:conserved exported protein of unknown function [Petrocella atlantisensis]|uniref:SCP domain-containing protein n=1 Tax=Petrocella atlantisensis TaxID=2173034 RepID=A0A3P7NZY0_9FIRM|nr:CAP domain-containing protein [Petrocella atlantisensis]VDN48714.1 conserved exported protein of unknown function [Petrocella atlantisensis]
MKKTIVTGLTVLSMILTMMIPIHASQSIYTVSTTANIVVDNKTISPRAYNIQGNNYFMLRDIAHYVNDSQKAFDVTWNPDTATIIIETGKPYLDGYVSKSSEDESAVNDVRISKAKILKNGVPLSMTGYVINGNTYYKLRDMGTAFGFNVFWDGAKNKVVIDTEGTVETVIKNQELSYEVLRLINIEREKAGLHKLVMDAKLEKAAYFKSNDMLINDYFEHVSPVHGGMVDIVAMHGVPYRYLAENIASGHTTAKKVVDGWMASPGHRKNILSPNLNKIGIGVVARTEYGYLWTQLFTD